jgi:hypothetical protein
MKMTDFQQSVLSTILTIPTLILLIGIGITLILINLISQLNLK